MLGSAGTALEWVAAGLDRGGLGLRPDDDLGGQASPGQSDRDALRQRGEADAEGDERLGDRGPSSAFAGEVVRRDPRNPQRSAGRLASFKSLRREVLVGPLAVGLGGPVQSEPAK